MNISSKEINLIQKIHTKVHNINLDLPSIIVIGSQSSGKSSVLESLIQKDILPRGTNIVTRCPIIIHLKYTEGNEEYEIVNTNKKYLLNDIRHNILRLMNDICGNSKCISNTPIILNLWIKDTLEFTIIDLPGLTKIPIGSQPDDIEIKIKDLIGEYAKQTNTFLLAVISATVDISNSEELKICKEYDPGYTRTIGVVTKIDLMDQNTDCINLLRNRVYPLFLGYVGVVNRSQKDLENGVSYAEFQSKEAEFFKKSVYSEFYEDEIKKRSDTNLYAKLSRESNGSKFNYTDTQILGQQQVGNLNNSDSQHKPSLFKQDTIFKMNPFKQQTENIMKMKDNKAHAWNDISNIQKRITEDLTVSTPEQTYHLCKIGTGYLRTIISELYKKKVQECMIDIKDRISHLIQEKERSLSVLCTNNPFLVQYAYHSTLQSLLCDLRNKDTSCIFKYTKANIIYDLLEVYKPLTCVYDYSEVEKGLRYDISIFINEDLLRSVVQKNMDLIYNKILGLQDRFLNIVCAKITDIKSDSYPLICSIFNKKVVDNIRTLPLYDCIKDYINIQSQVVGCDSLFIDSTCTRSVFGSYISVKNNMKKDMIISFTKAFLDKQIVGVREYVIKMNLYYLTEYIKKGSINSLCKVQIEDCKEILNQKSKIDRYKEEIRILREIYKEI